MALVSLRFPPARIPAAQWPLVRTLALVALAVVAVELTLFNLPFYNSLLAGDEIVITDQDTVLHDVEFSSDQGLYTQTAKNGSIEIPDIDRRIYSIYVRPQFAPYQDVQPIEVKYDDEDATDRTAGIVRLVQGVPQNDYISPVFMGEVRRLVLVFASDDAHAGLSEIVLNRTVPLRVNIVRILLLIGVVGGTLLIVKRRLWQLRRDPDSGIQRGINTTLVAGLVALAAAGAVLTQDLGPTFKDSVQAITTTHGGRYADLIDAFEAGQVALLATPDQSLIDAEYPYDVTYRSREHVSYRWDFAYYDGRYYVYFGIVPVLTAFWPFKMLTGEHLSTHLAVFLFGGAATVFIYLFWSRFAAAYLPRIPYVLYLVGAFTLYASTNLLSILWQPGDLEMPVAAGLAFTFAGLWLGLKSVAATGRRQVAAMAGAASALALAVGCRPTFTLVSALLLVYLYDILRRPVETRRGVAPEPSHLLTGLRNHIPLIVAVVVPYAVVAAGLMWYNYARFDSVLEFGASYQLTLANAGAFADLTPLGAVVKAGYGVAAYLFAGLTVRVVFPFFLTSGGVDLNSFRGFLYVGEPIGLVRLPALWALALTPWAVKSLRRSRPLAAHWIVVGLAVGLALMVVDSVMGGVHARYEADFLWLFGLAAIVTLMAISGALSTRPGLGGGGLAVCTALLLITGVLLTLVGVTSEFNWFESSNPATYEHLVNLFRIW
jgi:hypothetical protein